MPTTNCSTDWVLQSPFREHFNTNYVPTDTEIERIRAHLVPHDAELARLEALIRELTAQRDRVKEYIEPHRALISHPRRLPQDIIEEIFLRYLPTPHHDAIMSAGEPPLLYLARGDPSRSPCPVSGLLFILTAFFTSTESKHAAIVNWLERSVPLPSRFQSLAAGRTSILTTSPESALFFNSPRVGRYFISPCYGWVAFSHWPRCMCPD
ncbi:F-box domain-containing protein [Mycena sanguinolenta]|uniref:F-box domain-containing protein n=1 Tax=Mycena sanguinolenta TaxID=230812 RepID=A0A8H7DIS8_9AGAR|nr:F-box domain-containing protein [Mycena sanguinolenta]